MILVSGKEVKVERFPNGEARIDKASIEEGIKIVPVTLIYESDLDLINLMLIRRVLRKPAFLSIWYMPYSRMDRSSASYLFSLKYICEFINWLDFESVIIYDSHSDVTPALLNNSINVSTVPYLLKQTDFNKDKDYVFFPDAGAQKRYSSLIKAKNELTGYKRRNFQTGKIEKYEIHGKVKRGSRVFIIDDLCSKGKTFISAATELVREGAGNIYLVVPHCEKTIFSGELLTCGLIDKVYTTNSTLIDKNSCSQISVSPLTNMIDFDIIR